ncbi:MAG: outer membrane beta-barrel protein [Pseudomonadota bacterium]
MRSVKFLVAAGAASMLSSVALAADMAIMPPPAYAPAPVVEDFGGWYLRGDIGFSNQRVDRLNNVLDTVGSPTSVQKNSFGTAGIFGLGVGYKVNNWFRADITGEYRGNSQFFGTDHLTYAGPAYGVDTYHGTKSEWVVLGNAYVDLGTWWCMTPFIGAGVGGARVSINNFTDQSIVSGAPPVNGLAFGDSHSKWNLAWALHAGVAYKVTPNFTVELAYRYLDMGDGLTGDLRTFDGVNGIVNPTTFKSITSHDLKLGVRWDLSSPPAYAPPLMRKG